jgi:hypothetical protein
MFSKTAILFAAATALGAAAATPALANYSHCYENPSAQGCPGNYDVTKEPFYVAPQPHRSASHEMSRPAHQRG